MSDIKLKVTPDELAGKASEITSIITKISRQYNILKTTSEASAGYWEGDAADNFRKYVRSIDEDMRTVISRLSEHPTDLLKMAGVYSQNEIKIQEQIDTLPTDVIS